MRVSPTCSDIGQPVNATDFLVGRGWFVELARTATSRLDLIRYRGDGTNHEAIFHFIKVILCSARWTMRGLPIT